MQTTTERTTPLTATLAKQESVRYGATAVTYLGVESIRFDPPLEDRFRISWSFSVVDPRGETRVLTYSEGFPGGMTSKPSLKIGYRTYLNFEWDTQLGITDRIELTLRPEERGPSDRAKTPIALGTDYEFPTVAVRVTLDREVPAYSPEKIDDLIKRYPQSTREMYENASIKIYQVTVTTREGATQNYSVEDNRLFTPLDVTDGKGSVRVFLEYVNGSDGLVLSATVVE